jgi:hypothetical protein
MTARRATNGAASCDARPYDAGDRKQVERRQQAREAAARRIDDALRWVMGDPRGRAFLWDLMARTNWLVSRMAYAMDRDGGRGAADPCLTAWNDGRAETANYLFGMIGRVCPQSFAIMQAEASAEAAMTSATPGEDDDGPADPS